MLHGVNTVLVRGGERPCAAGEAIVISSIPRMTERYLPDGRVRGLRQGAEKGREKKRYRSC